jgi:hypothetical protein
MTRGVPKDVCSEIIDAWDLGSGMTRKRASDNRGIHPTTSTNTLEGNYRAVLKKKGRFV